MVRGNFVNGVAEIVLAVILFAFSAIVAIVLWTKMKDDMYSEWVLFLVPLIIPIVFALFFLYDGITRVMSPEYGAVMTMLKMVK